MNVHINGSSAANDDMRPDANDENDWRELDVEPSTGERVRVADGLKFERGDHVEIAQHYAATIAIDGQAVYDHGATFVYDAGRGVFAAIAPSAESCTVQSYAGAPSGEKEKPLELNAGDIEGSLKLARARLARPGFFDAAVPGLAFADGFVTVDATGATLVSHAPDHRARHGYRFDFGSAGEPKRFLTALGEVFEGDEDRADKIALIQEFSGACMFGIATRYQRCVVFDGEGANGKSTVIRMVEAAMPAGSVISIPPQRWGNEYRRAALAGALFNVVR